LIDPQRPWDFDGELTGISGTMGIDIADGKHNYTFEYSIST
jgi:hypothetical protein